MQSSAKKVQIYNSLLTATVAVQGAGLVNAYQALTATTMFSPGELGLNDTIRRASSYNVSVINIGSQVGVYRMSYNGAALTTGLSANDDLILPQPLYSADYAVSLAL